MLTNPTMEHLKELKLTGMMEAYGRQLELPDDASLTFEERFSLIVDYEWTRRRTNQLNRLIRAAGFRQEALPEDIIKTESYYRTLNDDSLCCYSCALTEWPPD